MYSLLSEKDQTELINSILDQLEIKFELPDEDLQNIPESGPFITVSNHPYGGMR